MWKILAESNDVISIEKRKKSMNIRIEARKNSKNKWDVFKSYLHDEECNVVNEYSTHSRDEAQILIDRLKKEKDPSLSQIKDMKSLEIKPLQMKMKRIYKEYEVEKWEFTLFNEREMNTVIVRYAESIIVDVVMHNRYKTAVERTCKELYALLGLHEFGVNIEYNIYTYDHYVKKQEKNNRSLLFGKVEMDFT